MKAPFPWHDENARLMSQLINDNKLSPTLLFWGQEGLGINAFIDALITRLLNLSPLVKVNDYPFLYAFNPEEKMVHVDDIRLLNQQLRQKVVSNHDKKIVVIENVALLNNACSNALLKLLEEPPNDTFFILTATKLSQLLPTITSRAFKLFFKSASKDEFSHYFNHQPDCEKWYSLSVGAPLLIEYWQQENLLDTYQQVSDALLEGSDYCISALMEKMKSLSMKQVFMLTELITYKVIKAKAQEVIKKARDENWLAAQRKQFFAQYDFILAQKKLYLEKYQINQEKFIDVFLQAIMQ